jgi:hypothetical protein
MIGFVIIYLLSRELTQLFLVTIKHPSVLQDSKFHGDRVKNSLG